MSAFDAISRLGTTGVATSHSFTHTPVGVPTEIVVGCWATNGVDTPGPTYGGNAVTQIVGASGISMWRLFPPPSGAQTVMVPFGVNNGDHYSCCFSVVGSLRPSSDGVADFADADNIITVPNTHGGDLILEYIGGTASGFTPNSGQTEVFDEKRTATNPLQHAAYWRAGLGGSTALNTSGAASPSHVACRIPGAAGGTKLIFMGFKKLLDDLKAGHVPPEQMRRRLERAWSI